MFTTPSITITPLNDPYEASSFTVALLEKIISPVTCTVPSKFRVAWLPRLILPSIFCELNESVSLLAIVMSPVLTPPLSASLFQASIWGGVMGRGWAAIWLDWVEVVPCTVQVLTPPVTYVKFCPTDALVHV